jgi:hypothetical protein
MIDWSKRKTAAQLAEEAAQRAAEQQAQQQRQQLNDGYEGAKLAPALKVLAEKLLTADIVNETLPENEAQAVAVLFPPWEGSGVTYALGKVVRYNDHLYEVMQAHTSQADWAPDAAPTLFRRRYEPTGGIPVWQPWDGHNASLYQVGQEVEHNGSYWKSTTPNNHWEPGVFGWQQTGEVPEPTVPDWQPWTSGLNEDLYQIGDEVMHNGQHWRATLGDNHWEPGVAGWELVE